MKRLIGGILLTKLQPLQSLSLRELASGLSDTKRKLASSSTMERYDKKQVAYMQNERCILVTPEDRVCGYSSKAACHAGEGLLHRAFSLFLFRNDPNRGNGVELLMQRRADQKITFPNLWTNTCCSHPLQDYPQEMEELDALGVKHAARRKVQHELGIDGTTVLPLEDICYLKRVIYSAPNEPYDGLWSERELDYILGALLPRETCTDIESGFMLPNLSEVSDVSWSNLGDIKAAARCITSSPLNPPATLGRLTPWMRGIVSAGILDLMWNWVEHRSVMTENVDDSASLMLQHKTAFSLVDGGWNRDHILAMQTD